MPLTFLQTSFALDNSSLVLNPIILALVLQATSQVPTAVVISPLGQGHPADTPPPILDYPHGPPRCNRCRAYINAFVRVSSDSLTWFCNFCSARNGVPDHGHMAAAVSDRPEMRLCDAAHPCLAFLLQCSTLVQGMWT
jgi:Sec23/Sec24 zinc finger